MKKILGIVALSLASACTGDVMDMDGEGEIGTAEQLLSRDSCEDRCGDESVRYRYRGRVRVWACGCDEACIARGDCCEDVVDMCSPEEPEEPGEPDAGTPESDAGTPESDAGTSEPPPPPPPVDGDPRGEVPTSEYCAPAYGFDPAWAQLEVDVLERVNQVRSLGTTCGGVAMPAVGALTMNPALRCAARVHSLDMAANNFMAHNGSNGSTPWQRMNLAGYAYRSAGENVAAGYATAQAVVTGWLNSTGHCNNMMGAGFREIGVGYAYGASTTYKHYWTQGFGSR